MAIALACLSAAFSIFPTFEKNQNFKLLQYVNGVNGGIGAGNRAGPCAGVPLWVGSETRC